jgi:hypothetical protein
MRTTVCFHFDEFVYCWSSLNTLHSFVHSSLEVPLIFLEVKQRQFVRCVLAKYLICILSYNNPSSSFFLIIKGVFIFLLRRKAAKNKHCWIVKRSVTTVAQRILNYPSVLLNYDQPSKYCTYYSWSYIKLTIRFDEAAVINKIQ